MVAGTSGDSGLELHQALPPGGCQQMVAKAR